MDRNSLEFIFYTKCYFYWLIKKNPRSKARNQQQTQPTYGIGPESTLSHIDGKRVLSPLHYTCSQGLEVFIIVNIFIVFLTVTGQAHNFNKYSHGKLDYLGAMYDFQSLMHYGSHAFSKNGKRTIKAIKQPSLQFGQRKGFSETDIQQLNALYDCKSECLT